MKFQTGQSVIVIDTLQKPAGNGVVISYNPFTRYYNVNLTYYDLDKQEAIEVPEHRLLMNTDVVDSSIT